MARPDTRRPAGSVVLALGLIVWVVVPCCLMWTAFQAAPFMSPWTAEQEARRQRAEAELRQEKATLHERGMADHELIEDHERERFAGTSAVPDSDAREER